MILDVTVQGHRSALLTDSAVLGFRSIENVARRTLAMLNNALSLEGLRVTPGNRLEKLAGDLQGQHSFRVNDQWRIGFVWHDRKRLRGRNYRLSLNEGEQ